ncbi:hypothetical protein Dthio_PD3681 [Desulfonatronospira thiodismutans ASO3-1]|uniref:Uncharacterized protein n=1 Tax=Desulfonatronospira thiodismutans ASO3-1 TaxID=555779 RepID=D6SK21_9BACT|nr:hypothetical protein [Desulfonatronospira thiodismutans]EFI36224.1 hypothetical protein Dthio_PD3681 [Desulfonatronospira thiodismutans ASO3-1]
MKKYLWLTFIPVILFMAGLSQASYRIELESGKSVITRHYWEEDDWVMFYQYDGVVGYPAHLVRDIRESDRLPPDEAMEKAVGGEQREDLETTDVDLIEEADEAKTDMDPEEFERKVEQYQEELRDIYRRLVVKSQEYYSAMRENRPNLKKEARNSHQKLMDQKKQLKQKVIEAYKGEKPDWWDKIISQEN